jgi:hypothetical protein
VTFTVPDRAAACLAEIRQLPGVQAVDLHNSQRAGARVSVLGDRSIIAHVGAILVRGGTVPDDLSVHVPDLDDALQSLLDRPGDDPPAPADLTTAGNDLVGGRR